MKYSISFIVLLFAFMTGCTQSVQRASGNMRTSLAAIHEDELRRDLYALASDSMRGRRAGTIDEMRAAAWVAQQAQKAGLQPAGDDGTYFQFFPLRRTRVADNSQIQLNGNPLVLWKNVWVTPPFESHVDGPVLWLKSLADTARPDISGKAIAMMIQPPSPQPAPGMSLWGYRYALSAIRQQSTTLKAHGAIAVILVADAATEAALGFVGHNFEEGLYQLDGAASLTNNINIPILLIRQTEAAQLQQANATIAATIHVENFIYPSVNVVAVASGTDAQLKNEYVVFSGHHDHDGVGVPVAGDSIWNGADDNASVSVALLAIARAWVKQPSKRSALFIWHGAEERGLLGSRWYAEHPTVPKSSLIAVLNGDMIGRNAPDSAALLGVTPPHRNSVALVDMAMQANNEFTHFKIDTTWDNPNHPENWYFRSDHLPYARAGIPAIFFSTLLHPDYHTPRDEAQRIDYTKLTRMTRWMYATGWMVANAVQRPALDVASSKQ